MKKSWSCIHWWNDPLKSQEGDVYQKLEAKTLKLGSKTEFHWWTGGFQATLCEFSITMEYHHFQRVTLWNVPFSMFNSYIKSSEGKLFGIIDLNFQRVDGVVFCPTHGDDWQALSSWLKSTKRVLVRPRTSSRKYVSSRNGGNNGEYLPSKPWFHWNQAQKGAVVQDQEIRESGCPKKR